MPRGLGLKHFSVLFWKTLLQSNNLFTMKLVVNLLHNISAGQIRFLQLDQVSSVRLISSCYVCKVNQVQQTHLRTKQIFRLVYLNRPFEEKYGMMLLSFIIISPSMEYAEFPLRNKYFSLLIFYLQKYLNKPAKRITIEK